MTNWIELLLSDGTILYVSLLEDTQAAHTSQPGIGAHQAAEMARTIKAIEHSKVIVYPNWIEGDPEIELFLRNTPKHVNASQIVTFRAYYSA